MKYFKFVVIFSFLLIALFLYINNWSWVHAKKIHGVILRVERIDPNVAIMQSGDKNNAQVFSFAVSIKDENGQIFTSSTEDRQWAVATPGLCVVARFEPYPPWNLEKSGTFFNARLKELSDCPQK